MGEEELEAVRDNYYILRDNLDELSVSVSAGSARIGLVEDSASANADELSCLKLNLLNGLPAILYEALDNASVMIDERDFEEKFRTLIYGS